VLLIVCGSISLVLFISISYNYFLNQQERVLIEQEIESEKMHINSELMELARSRTRIVSEIIYIDDIFEQDELNIQLDSLAGRFAQLRTQLLELPLTEEEKALIKVNDSMVPLILPAQRQAVELVMHESVTDKEKARQILFDTVLPGQQKMIDSFTRLIDIEQHRIADLTLQSHEALLEIEKHIKSVVSTALVMAVLLSTVIFLRVRFIQQTLRQSNEQLEKMNVDLEHKIDERTKELSVLNERLKEVSERDELTGLYNRRKFNEFLENEYARANRDGSCFAIILTDIDSFKLYNDNYGHQKGDECLASVAATMCSCLPRSTDLIARYGGEEFVIVLPATDADGAFKVAETIRQRVLDERIPHEYSEVEGTSCITVCLGVEVYSAGDDKDTSDILERADQRLYAAKTEGRNRTIMPETDSSSFQLKSQLS
jgi:diguanylate cyclase (GGDEF)-like protein